MGVFLDKVYDFDEEYVSAVNGQDEMYAHVVTQEKEDVYSVYNSLLRNVLDILRKEWDPEEIPGAIRKHFFCLTSGES